jgi:hypothetical protein
MNLSKKGQIHNRINSIDLNIVFKAVLCYIYLLNLMKAFVKKIYRLDSFT